MGGVCEAQEYTEYVMYSLTTEVEQVPKEEACFVEGLKLGQRTLFEISSEWLSPSFL